MQSLKDMGKSKLVLIGVAVLIVVGFGVGLGFAFAGPSDKKTTTTTITCKKGTDDCTVKGDVPKNDNVGPDAPDPSGDQWQKDQRDIAMPWADYNGRPDIIGLRMCAPIDEQDLCYAVTNHSKWKLDYDLDITYYDKSGARIGTDTLSTIDVAPGQTDRQAEQDGAGSLMPEGTVKVTLDDVKVVGSECADSGACNGYDPPAN